MMHTHQLTSRRLAEGVTEGMSFVITDWLGGETLDQTLIEYRNQERDSRKLERGYPQRERGYTLKPLFQEKPLFQQKPLFQEKYNLKQERDYQQQKREYTLESLYEENDAERLVGIYRGTGALLARVHSIDTRWFDVFRTQILHDHPQLQGVACESLVFRSYELICILYVYNVN